MKSLIPKQALYQAELRPAPQKLRCFGWSDKVGDRAVSETKWTIHAMVLSLPMTTDWVIAPSKRTRPSRKVTRPHG